MKAVVLEKMRKASEAFATKLAKRHVVATAIMALAAVVLLFSVLKALLGIALLFVLGAFSTYYKRKLEAFGAVGFELVTFTAVMAGIAFGPLIGALFGLAVSAVSVAISRDIGPTTLFFILATAAIGAIAKGLSSAVPTVALGMASLAFSTFATHAFTFLVQRDTEIKIVAATGIVVNFFVNYILFAFAAEPILRLFT
ncbi:hypothetical protein HYU17_01965 [Candidatus Woesearchaeota archaeon]|nr:hypothetical protein [Candidatus Woesearchaeota archaeon]